MLPLWKQLCGSCSFQLCVFFWAAHRTHVYQQLCDLGLSHRSVTIIYTTFALLFAALGLAYGDMPPWGQAVAWWGSILIGLVSAVFVVARNAASKK